MHYYMYQIKNIINGKVYVGVHKTSNLEDGYMGSGKAITSAVLKYGIENFTKTVLETFESSDQMFSREKEIVNEEFLSRTDVYNILRGGSGGWDHARKFIKDPSLNGKIGASVSNTKENRQKKSISMVRENPMFDEDIKNKQRVSLSSTMNNPDWKATVGIKRSDKISKSMTGRNRSDAEKQKISKSTIGFVRVTIDGVKRRIKKEFITDDMTIGWK